MKRFSSAPWFCIVCLGVTAAAWAQTEPVAVPSAIKDVTIYSDRARVSRSAKVSLKAGTTVCAFQKLPGWIDEQSIRIALASAGGGRITDVQARREYLARAGDEELRKAETAVREIADRLAALDDEAKVLDAQGTQVEATRVFSLENLSDTETTLRLTDRIPMSENKDIRVYRVRIAPEVDPDSNGLLNWNLILKPKARSVFRVEYSIEYPQDYVEHMKKARGSSMDGAAPSSKADLSVQIEKLEMGCD